MIVLITGGASGLGEAITKKFASKKEYFVYFTYNNSNDKAAQLEKSFPNCKGIKCDFKKETDIQSLLNHIKVTELSILINNAYNGTFIGTYFNKTDHQFFLEAFETNIIPTIRITQEVISNFKKQKKGTIITILTESLEQSAPIGSSVYTSTKAYLKQLVEIWASENSKFNIISSSVSPGFMETNFTKNIDERLIEQIREKSPLKKLQTTIAVAEDVFLLDKS